MAAPSVNLKTVVEADTSQFDAKMKTVKSDLKDLGSVSSSAFSSLGSALGLSAGKLGQFAGAISGLAVKFGEMGQAGASAFSVAAAAAKSLGGAIAGVGIASAVVGFKALNAEAEAFKNTVAGANIELQTAAYISTYKQALHDINSETGRNFANFLANIKKRAGTFLGAAGYSVINFFDTDKTYDQIGAGLKEANRLGTEAEQIAGRIYSFQRKIADRAVEISELDAKISEYRRIAQDSTESAERRSQALAQATELIKQKYEGPNGLVMLNDGLANLMQQQVSLTGSSAEAIDAANQQRIKANQYVRAENDELRALSRLQKTINGQVAKEASERQKVAEAAKAMAASKASLAEWSAQATTPGISTPSTVETMGGAGLAPIQLQVSNWAGFFKDVDGGILREWPNGVQVGVKFKYEEGLMDMTREVNAAMQSLAETTGSVIGQLVGDLTTGGNAWANFGDAAISALGDMAISIGKIAIQAGIASLGIEAAITALGGTGAAMAIGAGVALVALGTAVKTGLSNVASGSYSAGASIASSGYSTSSGGDYETREINVKVTGTLTGEGSTLLGVINSTENKNYHTT